MTVGTPSSTMATHEFVVPRSMPMTRSIQPVLLLAVGVTGICFAGPWVRGARWPLGKVARGCADLRGPENDPPKFRRSGPFRWRLPILAQLAVFRQNPA